MTRTPRRVMGTGLSMMSLIRGQVVWRGLCAGWEVVPCRLEWVDA